MQIEARQPGIKRITVKAPAELPYLVMAYRAPVLRDVESDWEPYALFVLNGILDGNNASRLNRELVTSMRVANSAGSSYDLINRGPALFVLDGVPAEGKTVADVEAALREQIRVLVEQGVSNDELQRVKAQITAAQVYARDSVYNQAHANRHVSDHWTAVRFFGSAGEEIAGSDCRPGARSGAQSI